MLYYSMNLFCLKLCSVDKAHLCRACPLKCLCLLYRNSHVRFLRRSKESQSVKEAFFTRISKITPIFASCQMLQILA